MAKYRRTYREALAINALSNFMKGAYDSNREQEAIQRQLAQQEIENRMRQQQADEMALQNRFDRTRQVAELARGKRTFIETGPGQFRTEDVSGLSPEAQEMFAKQFNTPVLPGANIRDVEVVKSSIPGALKGQQSSYSFPDGTPAVFDPITKSYIPAAVDAGTKLVPKPRPLPASEVQSMADSQALESLIGRIEEQYNANPKLVGSTAVKERFKMNKGVQMVGALLGSPKALQNDPEASEFLRNLSSLKSLRSFSLGGKQLTPTEIEQLEKALPSEFSPATFRSDLNRFRQEVSRVLEARQRGFIQAGYTGVSSNGNNDPLGIR